MKLYVWTPDIGSFACSLVVVLARSAEEARVLALEKVGYDEKAIIQRDQPACYGLEIPQVFYMSYRE